MLKLTLEKIRKKKKLKREFDLREGPEARDSSSSSSRAAVTHTNELPTS